MSDEPYSIDKAWQAALDQRSDLTRNAVRHMIWPDLRKIRYALILLDEVTEREVNRRKTGHDQQR